jgi:hypothetical protein
MFDAFGVTVVTLLKNIFSVIFENCEKCDTFLAQCDTFKKK